MGPDCPLWFVIVFQEEEESLAEGSKDDPGEQAELREEGEAPVEDTSRPPSPEPKGNIAPEGEKPVDKENGEKPEAQVSSRLDREAKRAGAACLCLFPLIPTWRIGGPELFLISSSLSAEAK